SSKKSHKWPIQPGAVEAEHALMKKVFTDYNLKVRPARTPEERVVVRVGMILSSFVGLNMKNEEMSTIVVMNLEWTDYRLTWKPKEHDGIEVLRVPSGKMWLPDIVLINKTEGQMHKGKPYSFCCDALASDHPASTTASLDSLQCEK
ncbi:hypothetical protein AMECASPLE_030832, partial [Ameca splendens]